MASFLLIHNYISDRGKFQLLSYYFILLYYFPGLPSKLCVPSSTAMRRSHTYILQLVYMLYQNFLFQFGFHFLGSPFTALLICVSFVVKSVWFTIIPKAMSCSLILVLWNLFIIHQRSVCWTRQGLCRLAGAGYTEHRVFRRSAHPSVSSRVDTQTGDTVMSIISSASTYRLHSLSLCMALPCSRMSSFPACGQEDH